METYPKLRYPGEEATQGLFASGSIVIQEKLDGSNFRFTWEPDTGFTFGSRRTEGEGLHRDQFADAIEYVEENVSEVELRSQHNEFGKLVYFGEFMNPHTISYDWEGTPDFIGFDVWSEDAQNFLTTGLVQSLFDGLDLPTAPIVTTVSADEWDDYDFECPESEYYDGKAEGVVFKNHTTDTYGKYVREDFKEKSKQTFGPSKKSSLNDTERMVYAYITEARIRKAIYRLQDEEGKKIRMEMMAEGLPQEVISDFVDEEGFNVFMNENWKIGIGEFRSIVSSRCAEVLRREVDKKVKEEL